jgi:hypothetical protein
MIKELLFLGTFAAMVASGAEEWDTFADTWVGTDGLGRVLPTVAEAGVPKKDRTVGVFYFLWLDHRGTQGPYDNSKILAANPNALQNPASPPWGPPYASHYWGEPLFGYYLSTDEAVIRKHAQMLADAGVDAVFFDVSNGPTYPESYMALMHAFAEMRSRGNRTPQVAFLCPFGRPQLDTPRGKVLETLWNTVYRPGLHPELWFRWEGKPLILADPAAWRGHLQGQPEHDTPEKLLPGQTLTQWFTAGSALLSVAVSCPTWGARAGSGVTLTVRREGKAVAEKKFTDVVDNAWQEVSFQPPLPAGDYQIELSNPVGTIGWWRMAAKGERTFTFLTENNANEEMLSFFTFRAPEPSYFLGPAGRTDCWSWLEVFPQHVFYNSRGEKEMMSVGVAQNAVGNRLGCMSEKGARGRSYHVTTDVSAPAGSDAELYGLNFTEQWGRALKEDPRFLFITGWNEWIASRFNEFCGVREPVMFVDEFDLEHSRDCEPMRGGHGDNYYYQLIAGIRRFKGVHEVPRVMSRPIRIDGNFGDWDAVSPEFRDTLGDPVRRDWPGWGTAGRYVNQTGRNDIRSAKVSVDGKAVYFYVKADGPLSPRTDPNWMILFIDADQNAKTGWLGYDFAVNRIAGRIEQYAGGGYNWKDAGAVEMRIGVSEIELAVPSAFLVDRIPSGFDFKWADGILQTGEWSDFTLNGDVAPNDRYNYRARF